MLLSAVSVLVVAQSSSEIPEGLTNNTVYFFSIEPKHNWMCSVKVVKKYVREGYYVL